MCLGIYVCCVLVVLCLSLGCVFCFLWCVVCCWVIWCACVSWVFCVCVCVAYCVVCALCVCSFIGCAWCFMCGVVSLLVCCAWCFGCWSLPVWLWWVSGFGRVLFFVFGFWLGFVFWLVAGVLFFVGWLRAGLVGGLFLLVVWVVASYFFWSYIICVDCGEALRVSACVGFLFGVTACFLGVYS